MPDNSTAEPPEENSFKWDLGDGGQWKSDNPYPVYVLPGSTGHDLVTATAQYSGDMESVPHGDQLRNTFDAGDYVRLFVDIDTGKLGSSTYQHHQSGWTGMGQLRSPHGNVRAKKGTD